MFFFTASQRQDSVSLLIRFVGGITKKFFPLELPHKQCFLTGSYGQRRRVNRCWISCSDSHHVSNESAPILDFVSQLTASEQAMGLALAGPTEASLQAERMVPQCLGRLPGAGTSARSPRTNPVICRPAHYRKWWISPHLSIFVPVVRWFPSSSQSCPSWGRYRGMQSPYKK